jgi:hypothetical protein
VPPKRCLAIACAVGVLSALTAPARAADAGRLPEDPAAGAKSTAQWREHMAAEDHERRLHYDRDRIKDHRAVLKFLTTTRGRYDRAKTKAAVLAIQKRLPPAVDDVRRRITAIDHWGTNSNLLGDYEVMLKALSDGYPAARSAALGGNRAPLAALQADLDARTKHIKDWLAEAAASKDE